MVHLVYCDNTGKKEKSSRQNTVRHKDNDNPGRCRQKNTSQPCF